MSKIDLVGRRFGRLTVIEKAQKGTQFKDALWACECRCGGENTVSTSSLVRGLTKSCGCLFKEMLRRRIISDCQYKIYDDCPETIEELCDLVNW